MSGFSRFKNRALAELATGHPSFGKMLTESLSPVKTKGVPCTPVRKPLIESTVAVVTKAGVHSRLHIPFDMENRERDPSFRVIDVSRSIEDLMIAQPEVARRLKRDKVDVVLLTPG